MTEEPITAGMKKINLIRQYGVISFLAGMIMGAAISYASILVLIFAYNLIWL